MFSIRSIISYLKGKTLTKRIRTWIKIWTNFGYLGITKFIMSLDIFGITYKNSLRDVDG